VLNLTFTTEYPKDVRIFNKSNKPIGDISIQKIVKMPNGFMSAQVGQFNLDNKVVATFANNIPAGARDRAALNVNHDVQARRRSVLDFLVTDPEVNEAACVNDQMQPEDNATQSVF
jgi:hypothetical protein